MNRDTEMSFIGEAMQRGQELAEQDYAGFRQVGAGTGRTIAASFPPFGPGLRKGENLEVMAHRPTAGKSLLVQDLAQLEQRLIAQGVMNLSKGAPTYCGVPIVENKHLPPGTVYLVASEFSAEMLSARFADLVQMMDNKA